MNPTIEFADIHQIVEEFYQKATVDILIGFHFRHIQDLPKHVARISYFWQLQLTGKIDQSHHLPFNIIGVHRPMKLTSGMVDRWIVLFHQTLDQSHLNQDTIKLWKEKIELFRQRIKSIQVTS